MTAYDSDDEPITLSAHALAALAEFNQEKDSHEKEFIKLQAAVKADTVSRDASGPLSMEAFREDWNESQFWYSDETASLLASQLLDGVTPEMTVAVVSAPSVFIALKNTVRENPEIKPPKMVLLEHDNRFRVFPEFVFYDFQQPFKLPDAIKGTVDRVVCDPPFLSEDCQTKAALTVKWMCKVNATSTKVILCTGERMQTLALKVYKSFGLKTTTFEPKHVRGLSNEFYCYANFECEEWKWR